MKTTLIFLLSSLAALGRTYTVTWDKYKEPVTITVYQRQPVPMVDTPLGSVQINPLDPALETVDVIVGEGEATLYALAQNTAGIKSAPSGPLVIPPRPAAPARLSLKPAQKIIQIETSSNLKDWQTLAYIPLVTDAPAQFVRAGITITP